MGLSKELINQFVKTTNDSKKNQNATVYGTAVKYSDTMYAKIDGSEMLTPISSAITAKPGDRILITIANHAATALGNLSTPSASSETVESLSNQVFHKVTTDEIEAINASLDHIEAITINTEYANIVNAEIENLKAKLVNTEHLSADDIKAINAEIENLEAKIGTFENLSTENLKALTAEITNLKGYTAKFTYVSTEILEAVKATIRELNATIIDAETGNFKFANIDFSNIDKAAVEQFFATSGIIKDVTVGDQTVTGELVGVTIKGDLIEGGTIVADKLVIKGEDGLYYKLNTDGETIETEQTEYNSLDGTHILAKSITATKIDVKDLVAFDATIGGFKITDSSIYSGVKESVDNTTRGSYLDKDGQIALGDGKNYIKYYKDAEENYILAISASEIIMSTSGKSVDEVVNDVADKAGNSNLIRNSTTLEYESYSFDTYKLPSEYQEVESICAKNGTSAHIRLDCPFTGGKILTSIYATDNEASYLFGVSESGKGCRAVITNDGLTIKVGPDSEETVSTPYKIGRNECVFIVNNQFAKNQNMTTGKSGTAEKCEEYIVNDDLYLFAIHQDGGMTYSGTRQIGYFRYWDKNNILKCDLVPCYRVSDNKVGMYDFASNTFYTSDSTDDFAIGDRIEWQLLDENGKLLMDENSKVLTV